MKALLSLLVAAGLAMVAPPRWVEDGSSGGRVRVSLYRLAPGKQLDYLRWQAIQDEVAKEAGVPVPEIYVHLDGDAWDYLVIAPVTTPEQDKKLDEIAARRGLKTGFPAFLEFRQLLASHTDTRAAGPKAAAELAAAAVK
jgi:hypothetical protein